MYPQLLAWPDQLDRNGLTRSTELPSDQRAAALFRLGELHRAESLLTAYLPFVVGEQQVAPLVLLAWMRLENRDLSGFQSVFHKLQRNWADQPEVRALFFKFLLVTGRGHSIFSSSSEWLSFSDPQLRRLFQLLHTEWLIVSGRIAEADVSG